MHSSSKHLLNVLTPHNHITTLLGISWYHQSTIKDKQSVNNSLLKMPAISHYHYGIRSKADDPSFLPEFIRMKLALIKMINTSL